jgi:hypothetical protein
MQLLNNLPANHTYGRSILDGISAQGTRSSLRFYAIVAHMLRIMQRCMAVRAAWFRGTACWPHTTGTPAGAVHPASTRSRHATPAPSTYGRTQEALCPCISADQQAGGRWQS